MKVKKLTYPSRASLIKIEKNVYHMAQINLFYIVNSCILYGGMLLRSGYAEKFKYSEKVYIAFDSCQYDQEG